MAFATSRRRRNNVNTIPSSRRFCVSINGTYLAGAALLSPGATIGLFARRISIWAARISIWTALISINMYLDTKTCRLGDAWRVCDDHAGTITAAQAYFQGLRRCDRAVIAPVTRFDDSNLDRDGSNLNLDTSKENCISCALSAQADSNLPGHAHNPLLHRAPHRLSRAGHERTTRSTRGDESAR
jgi:hypothetical protein